MSTPATVTELFPSKWLKAEDLGSRQVTVKIAGIAFEELRQMDGSKELKAVVSFEKATKRLVLNKTQAGQIAGIIGSDRFADWPGHVVVLAPAIANNGKATIAIRQPAATPAAVAVNGAGK